MKSARYLIIGALLFFIGFVVAYFLLPRRSQPPSYPQPAPEGADRESFKNIVPGVSTARDVQSNLGNPSRTDSFRQFSEFVYPSGLEDKPVLVELDSAGKVGLIIEPVGPEENFVMIQKELGSESFMLYGTYFTQGFKLIVYLEKGVAYLANPVSGQIKERWYFAPVTANNFQALYAPGFYPEPPKELDY